MLLNEIYKSSWYKSKPSISFDNLIDKVFSNWVAESVSLIVIPLRFKYFLIFIFNDLYKSFCIGPSLLILAILDQSK